MLLSARKMLPRVHALERDVAQLRQSVATMPNQSAAMNVRDVTSDVKLTELEGKINELRAHIHQDEAKVQRTMEEVRNKILSVEAKSRSDLDALSSLIDQKIKTMDNVDSAIQEAIGKNFESIAFGQKVIEMVTAEVPQNPKTQLNDFN